MTQASIAKRVPEKTSQAPISTTEELEKQERDSRNRRNFNAEVFYLSMLVFWTIVAPCLIASAFFYNFIPIAAGTVASIGLVVWIMKYKK